MHTHIEVEVLDLKLLKRFRKPWCINSIHQSIWEWDCVSTYFFQWWWHNFYLLNYLSIKIIFTRITLSSFTKSCIALQPILDLKTEDFNGLNIFTEKLHLSNQLQRWKLEARSKSPNLLLPAFYPVIHLRIHPHMGIIHYNQEQKEP